MQRARNFLYVAIGLAAFAATAGLIHALLPAKVPKGVAAKLKFFSDHKDEFDTVIVGTSQLYYAASPEVFDEVTRESGLPTRTFNFGIDGMHPPENFYVLDQILKTRPKKLKWVLLELGDVQARWKKMLGTERAVYWHDWPRTKLTLEKALNPRGTATWLIQLTRLWLARRDLAANLTLFGKQFANVGRAADFLPAAKRERFADSAVELGPNKDGYRLAGEAMSPAEAEGFQKRLAQETALAGKQRSDPATERGYRDAALRIRAAGAQPIFVLPPNIFQSAPPLQQEAAPVPVIAFNDARKFPEFYDPGARVDDTHLTRDAAENFTRLLAREFLRHAAAP